MPGHQCRFAVRALTASPGVLFLEASVSRIALNGLSHASILDSEEPSICTLRRSNSDAALGLTHPAHAWDLIVLSGNGISTVCPSPTPFGLGLGPTNPPRMNLAAETSAIRWGRFLTSLALLMPAFSLRCAPPRLPTRLRCAANAPLPRPVAKIGDQPSAASAPGLSPGTLS